MTSKDRDTHPVMSRAWLVELTPTSGDHIRAVRGYMQSSANTILGPELYGDDFWKSRMSNEGEPGKGLGDQHFSRFMKHAIGVVKTFREASSMWGADGDDPRMRVLGVSVLLAVDEARLKAKSGEGKGGAYTYRVLGEHAGEYSKADTARKDEILAEAAERGRVEIEKETAEAEERRKKLKEYADAHNINEERLEEINDMTMRALRS
jgi:ADP-ribose pyrophosphatase YjhB (NUDIX family)